MSQLSDLNSLSCSLQNCCSTTELNWPTLATPSRVVLKPGDFNQLIAPCGKTFAVTIQ